MIRWKEVDDALGAVVSAALKAANLPAVRERKDVKAPLVRRSYRIDVGQTDGMGTDDYAETGCDIEIYFYPADGTRPRDELNTAADAIRAALREGVTVQDVVLIPEDDITCDADGETLAQSLQRKPGRCSGRSRAGGLSGAHEGGGNLESGQRCVFNMAHVPTENSFCGSIFYAYRARPERPAQ